MYQFNYHSPATLEEAATLFRDADDPIYLAGGMTLIPSRFAHSLATSIGANQVKTSSGHSSRRSSPSDGPGSGLELVGTSPTWVGGFERCLRPSMTRAGPMPISGSPGASKT